MCCFCRSRDIEEWWGVQFENMMYLIYYSLWVLLGFSMDGAADDTCPSTGHGPANICFC